MLVITTIPIINITATVMDKIILERDEHLFPLRY